MRHKHTAGEKSVLKDKDLEEKILNCYYPHWQSTQGERKEMNGRTNERNMPMQRRPYTPNDERKSQHKRELVSGQISELK